MRVVKDCIIGYDGATNIVAIFIFAGWRNPNNKKFNNIDKEFALRCADGSNFNGNRSKWNNNK